MRTLIIAVILISLISGCAVDYDATEQTDEVWTKLQATFLKGLPEGSVEVTDVSFLHVIPRNKQRAYTATVISPVNGALYVSPTKNPKLVHFSGLIENGTDGVILEVNKPATWQDSTLFFYTVGHGTLQLSPQEPKPYEY